MADFIAWRAYSISQGICICWMLNSCVDGPFTTSGGLIECQTTRFMDETCNRFPIVCVSISIHLHHSKKCSVCVLWIRVSFIYTAENACFPTTYIHILYRNDRTHSWVTNSKNIPSGRKDTTGEVKKEETQEDEWIMTVLRTGQKDGHFHNWRTFITRQVRVLADSEAF